MTRKDISMDTSTASSLDRIESQMSTNDHLRRRSFPMNLISNNLRSRSSNGSLQARGNDAKFFVNLSLSDLFDLAGEYVPMDPQIFCAARTGNKEGLEKLRINKTTPMACFKSEGGDSVLHLVAASGNLEVVKSIICESPCLLLEPNRKNQLPIHVAAGAGHVDVVEAFVETLTFVSGTLSEEERETLNLYVLKDVDGDTAMHLALEGLHMDAAQCLVNANQEASFLANKNGISPLYLAIRCGNASLVKSMLKEREDNSLSRKLEGRKDLVHAALQAHNTDILDIILTEDPSLEDERDEEGRTCLSFGASIGFYDGVCYLFKRTPKSVYICNDDGSFPIHLAVEKGHYKVVKAILNNFPDSKQLLNKHGHNILHIASCNGSIALSYLLVSSKHLLSEKDVNGNIPFHLATKNWCPDSVYLLKPKDLQMRNNNGLTALDIALSNLHPNYIFKERITLIVLLYLYSKGIDRRLFNSITLPTKPLIGDRNKDYVNSLLVVAALVATVTFAAAFTIPGGFNSSAPNLGMAALATNPKLICFLLFDTLAVQCSVLAIASLIWAQLGDHIALPRALFALFYSLVFMLVAFYCGVLIAVSNVTGLVFVLSVLSCFFLFVMIVLLIPHVALQRTTTFPSMVTFGHLLIILYLRYYFFDDDNDSEKPSAAHTSDEIARGKAQEAV